MPTNAAKAVAATLADELSETDAAIEVMQKQIQALESEAARLQEADDYAEDSADGMGIEQEDPDLRSIYVGNVDYQSTAEELQEHLKACGEMIRITILTNKFTGHPKGVAYVEFADIEGMSRALLMNGSLFRGRALKVAQKRTNIPGFKNKGGKGKGKGKKGKGRWASAWTDQSWGYGYAPWKPRYKGKGKYAPYW
mmetsp:Transcript_21132/g.58584  ORF Transcript_21132/g.58584 Transcript_21132/m.58584 type:complete len:196 (-) Transcript_21132:142-729(-)